jgi:hypothetical protein
MLRISGRHRTSYVPSAMTDAQRPSTSADDLVERLTRFRDRLIATGRPDSAAIVDAAIRDERRAAARAQGRASPKTP